MKKVSIIIPVYNMENFIERGISCITEQTYENLEIIIIDDGSKDNSYMKCLAEADKDRRIAVFSQNNKGPAAARNLALGKATGDYVYFFDIDDELRSDAIEKLVELMETRETDLAVCGFEMYDGKKVTRTVRKKDGLLRKCSEAMPDYARHLLMFEEEGIQGAPWYKLYKMSIIREYNIRFPDLRYGEDDVFIASYVEHSASFALTSEVLCRYYINNCRRFWDKYRFDMFDTVTKHTRYMADIVCAWNRDNTEVRDIIYRDYFQKTFSALCALFNPHRKMSIPARYRRIREISDAFVAQTPKEDFGVTHPAFRYMKNRNYFMVYIRILMYVIRHKFD